MQCPQCGGDMWDNRATKTKPTQPDYKCKDQSCGKAVWPPRNQNPRTMAEFNKENGYDLPKETSNTPNRDDIKQYTINRLSCQKQAIEALRLFLDNGLIDKPTDEAAAMRAIKDLTDEFQKDLAYPATDV